MTTNLPLNQILALLAQADTRDPNIHITPSVGARIDFLDVHANNNQGQLETSVFHKSAAEPYIVPFYSDHPRHIHRHVIRGALFRAVRVCSNVNDFDNERLNIELKLLLNGYPPRFIAYHFKQFFAQNNAVSLMKELNNEVYMKIHHELIYQLTRRERKVAEEQQQQQQPVPNKRQIQVLFTFETGPMLQFKDELNRLWKQFYVCPESTTNDITLRIHTRTNRSLNQLLSHTKPSKTLLR